MRPERPAIGIVVVLAGVGAAAVASIPAFLAGYLIADRSLQPHSPHWGEFGMGGLLLTVFLACILGLPAALSGWLGLGRRGSYGWLVTPVVIAAISGLSFAALLSTRHESLLVPVAFTIIFALTITGCVSGLMSGVVAASLQWPARQESDDRRRQNGVATSGQVQAEAKRRVNAPIEIRSFVAALVQAEAKRRVSAPGFALLVLGALNVAVSLRFLWVFATTEAAIRGPAPLGAIAIYLALGVLMIAGGSKMRNLQGYRYALVAAIAAIAAMEPMPFPFSFFGFPFGLWAYVVLLDVRIKAAFRR